MIYCDTSLFVAALTQEDRTSAVQAWLGNQALGQLWVSGWTGTEFSCALSRKARSGKLTPDQRGNILATWQQLLKDTLETAPIGPDTFVAAAAQVNRHELGIRASDALHLAIAASGGFDLATLDKAMAQAATTIGVSVVEIA